MQEKFVDLVATYRLFVGRFHDRAGDLEVLSVFKRFVDPSLEDTRVKRSFGRAILENLAHSGLEVFVSRALLLG